MPPDGLYGHLIDSAIDFAIISLDTEGRYNSWNIGAQHLFGYTAEEAIGQPGTLIFTTEDQKRGVPEKEMQLALLSGRTEDERWHQRKDGSRFWASGVMTALYDEAGTHLGYAKILRDLTERKQMEEMLVAANVGFHTINDELQQAKEDLERRVQKRTAELQVAHDLRHQLLQRLVNAQEEERRRLSRELHDQMGQQITALSLGLANVRALPLPPEAVALLDNLQSLSAELNEEVHRVSFALRPTALDDLGLIPALGNYMSQWANWSDISIQMELIGWDREEAAIGEKERLPGEIETTIYRIVQEALTNIARHAQGVTRVTLMIYRSAQEVRAIVEDNGPGFDVERAMNLPPEKRRLGLFGMQERALLVGGRLSIESEPGKGTNIILSIPLSS